MYKETKKKHLEQMLEKEKRYVQRNKEKAPSTNVGKREEICTNKQTNNNNNKSTLSKTKANKTNNARLTR